MTPRIKNLLLGLSPFIAILLIWEISSSLGLISEFLMPAPGKVFATFFKLIKEGVLLKLFLVSLLNIIPAFVLAAVAAVTMGTLIGVSYLWRRIFSPLLSAVYIVPSLAWLPLIILILGFTRETIWAVVMISSFTRIIYIVIGGIKSVNINYLLISKNLELSRLITVWKVILPAALPHILSALRIGFGSSWRSLVGAEMLVVTAGEIGRASCRERV